MEIYPDLHIEDFGWLYQWNSMGRPMLRIKFVDCAIRYFYGCDDEEIYSASRALFQLHESVRDISILDIKVKLLASTTMSLTSSSPPQVRIAIVADLVIPLIHCAIAFIGPCWAPLTTDIRCLHLKTLLK